MPFRNDPAGSGDPRPRRFRLPSRDSAPRTRSVLLATGLLVVVVAPLGVAATGSSLREGVRNGTTSRETEIVGNLKSSTGLKGGYVTRQSNLSSSGGGAVYGCRSQAGGSGANPAQNPCIRANNLSSGLAFEFNASNGNTVGAITTGVGGDTKKPFTTNATGVATGLNADRVDNLDAAQIIAATRSPFAQIASTGVTPGASNGLVASNPVTHTNTSGIYAVKFNGDLSKCAFSATIAETATGEISVVPAVAAGDTTVTVHTANSAGAAADRAFHLTANC
ncbi:MAG: hypothetical protein QOI73_1872 [Solirubrobacteraceae bacterium]|nr:hypothetical protein [Solirubrobacteraceae bacterium]